MRYHINTFIELTEEHFGDEAGDAKGQHHHQQLAEDDTHTARACRDASSHGEDRLGQKRGRGDIRYKHC